MKFKATHPDGTVIVGTDKWGLGPIKDPFTYKEYLHMTVGSWPNPLSTVTLYEIDGWTWERLD